MPGVPLRKHCVMHLDVSDYGTFMLLPPRQREQAGERERERERESELPGIPERLRFSPAERFRRRGFPGVANRRIREDVDQPEVPSVPEVPEFCKLILLLFIIIARIVYSFYFSIFTHASRNNARFGSRPDVSTKLQHTSATFLVPWLSDTAGPPPSPLGRPCAARFNCQRRVKIIGIWQRVIRDTLDDGGTAR